MRVCLISLGCPKNQVDGEVMLAALTAQGHTIAARPELAETVIVNTCGFIRAAQQESVNAILEMARLKQRGRLRHVIATGCLTQRYGAELLADIPELDAVVGTGGPADLDQVLSAVAGDERVSAIGAAGFLPDGVAPRLLSTPPWSAYLKVSEGCDNRCAYCVIPDLRGAHRSRPVAHLQAEVAQLVAAGVNEVTLVGQDLTRWGSDLPGTPDLADLLQALAGQDAPHWLRLHYLHPARVDDRLLSTIGQLDRVCKYLDLPMQHGSDPVLTAMRRGTTASGLKHLVARARELMPGVAIRSSFIVGFPGETDADFLALRTLMRDISVDWAGVFAYSREEGTPAATMADQVPQRTKARRRARAMALQRGISRRRSAAQLGRTLELLVEGPPRLIRQPDGLMADCVVARSYREAPGVDGSVFLRVAPGHPAPAPGTFVDGLIVAADAYDLYAVADSSPQM